MGNVEITCFVTDSYHVALVSQDYVIVVPATSYDDNLLTIKPIDKSVDFITKCGKNDYDIRYRSRITAITLSKPHPQHPTKKSLPQETFMNYII